MIFRKKEDDKPLRQNAVKRGCSRDLIRYWIVTEAVKMRLRTKHIHELSIS